jgi:hypothetical protein
MGNFIVGCVLNPPQVFLRLLDRFGLRILRWSQLHHKAVHLLCSPNLCHREALSGSAKQNGELHLNVVVSHCGGSAYAGGNLCGCESRQLQEYKE